MQNIEVFETEIGNHYVLEGNTNMIIPIDENLADVMRNNIELDRELIYRNSSTNIKNMMNKWPLFMKSESLFNYKLLKASYYSSSTQLILNVTENCNLRCRYCIFSGNNPGFRGRTYRSMPYEVATKSIDRYVEYIYKNPAVTITQDHAITFYGGEPLLEFDLIKGVVDYTKNFNIDFLFAMTTNATLIDEKKIKYLVDNNFSISISLDGPKDNHDRNRVFANGKGSYDTVYNNLLKLKEEVIKQGKESALLINLIVTLDEDVDLISVYDYFSNVIGTMANIARVNFESTTRDTCRPFVFSNFNSTYARLNALYRAKKINKDSEGTDIIFLHQLIGDTLNRVPRRFVSPYGNLPSDLIGGACIPGHKISASVDGLFHLCERVNENFPIGDYKAGFDDKKAENVLGQWSSVFNQHCRDCALKGICLPCESVCADIDRFKMDDYCKFMKPSLPNVLKTVYSMIENMQAPQDYHLYTSNKDDIFNFAA